MAPIDDATGDANPFPIRSVSSVAFSVGGDEAFQRVVRITVQWMRRLNGAIPRSADGIDEFDIGGGGTHPAKAIYLADKDVSIWSGSIDNPDSRVLGRTWITEITVAKTEVQTLVGVRLLNLSRGLDEPFMPSIPRLVRDMISDLPCATDGFPLSDAAYYVDSSDEVARLVALMRKPDRKLPVVVITDFDNGQTNIDDESFARKICGAAHLFRVCPEQTWELTDCIGRDLAVFDGAVRLYRPGLSLTDNDPYSHPRWMPDRSRRTQWTGNAIVARTINIGVSRGTTVYPRFEAVKQFVTERALSAKRANSTDAELIALFEEANQNLRSELSSLRNEQNQWLADAERERSQAERQILELNSQLERSRFQIERLRQALRAGMPQQENRGSYTEFGEWFQRNISSNIWIAPKAVKHIESAGQYRERDEIAAALRLLDERYVPMRRGESAEDFASWNASLEEAGLSVTNCFANRRDIRRYDEYSITYKGDRYWCDLHMKRGGGTDPRSMFRIYFCWHEEEKIVLIGHLPTHLSNNMTN